MQILTLRFFNYRVPWDLKEGQQMCGSDKRTRLECRKNEAGKLTLQTVGNQCGDQELCWPIWRHDTYIKPVVERKCVKGTPPVGSEDGQWTCTEEQ